MSNSVKIVSDWLTLVADLHGTTLAGGLLWTQFDDVIVLVVVFFALFSRSIGFQIFGNSIDMILVFFWVDCLLDGSCFPVFLEVQCFLMFPVKVMISYFQQCSAV